VELLIPSAFGDCFRGNLAQVPRGPPIRRSQSEPTTTTPTKGPDSFAETWVDEKILLPNKGKGVMTLEMSKDVKNTVNSFHLAIAQKVIKRHSLAEDSQEGISDLNLQGGPDIVVGLVRLDGLLQLDGICLKEIWDAKMIAYNLIYRPCPNEAKTKCIHFSELKNCPEVVKSMLDHSFAAYTLTCQWVGNFKLRQLVMENRIQGLSPQTRRCFLDP